MPVNTTFPGVYIQEIPSGVRTITGVSTSVTAFLGPAVRGPVNKAVHVLSLKDYENNFGGLSTDSPMSYAVSQFFLNGGTEAWIVRLAKDPAFATLELPDSAGTNVLKITALEEGTEANTYQVLVDDHSTDSTIGPNRFNLAFIYISQTAPASSRIETYKNLSMDPADAHYVGDMINGISQLVTVAEDTSSSGNTDTAGNKALPAPADEPGKALVPATTSTVPHPPVAGGPTAGKFISGPIVESDLGDFPNPSQTSFMIGFDGNPANTVVTIDKAPAAGSDLGEKLGDIASRIQRVVRGLKPGLQSWRDFTCTVSEDKAANPPTAKLVLASGTLSKASAIEVANAPDKSMFAKLHLDDHPTIVPARTSTLAGGVANPFTADEAFSIYTGDPVQRTGIFALDEVDLFNLLCLPHITDGGILTAALEYCKGRRAFLIADAPQGLTPQAMVDKITGPTLLPKGDDGTYAAIYYPWVKAPDPLKNGKLTSFPPSGMIAGLYARTDSSRGVWKAPAGTEATLLSVQAMDYLLTDAENGTLNPHGVNCLRIFPVYGAICWGSRTVSGDDQLASEYKYVPVRRLALYIEESLYRGTKWVVFEPNDEPLWAQIRLNVGAFMHNLFVKGAFQGATPKVAYFVKCDKETTTQNDIDLGIVNILVGFAPLKPAEFVIISLQQIAGQLLV